MNLEQLFKVNDGYLESSKIRQKRNYYYQLKEMLEQNIVTKLKNGLYKHNSLASSNEYIEISLMYPKAVICLYSAWSYYDLTTFIPKEYHISIPNKEKMKVESYPPLKLYYWSEPYYKLGKIKDGKIAIYSIERTVCDVIRFRNKVGMDLMKEVLENYLRREDRDLRELRLIAKKLNMEKKLNEYIEIML